MRLDHRLRHRPAIAKLDRLELFAGCTQAELALAATLTTEVQVAAGEQLIREGAPGAEAIIIAQGSAAVTKRHGSEGAPIALLGRGDVIGEISLLTGAPRNAAVTTLTDTSILVMNPREFHTLCARVPAVGARIRQLADQRVCGAKD
ncbi:MAG: hypothetical protein NVS3B12_33610 [Acidimicrobiales bacterium]